jgi:multisubunit Na+/H+ antiporter MnhG subunit
VTALTAQPAQVDAISVTFGLAFAFTSASVNSKTLQNSAHKITIKAYRKRKEKQQQEKRKKKKRKTRNKKSRAKIN